MSKPSIGILREIKNKWERRVPLIPKHIESLVANGIEIYIQPSDRRIYTNEEFKKVGAIITENLNNCNCILGVKEFNSKDLIDNKSYLIFSHTIKAQPNNMPFLDKCIEKNVRLFDYEVIKNDKGRLVAFGRYAGITGMIDCFRGLGARLLALGFSTPFMGVSSTYMYPTLDIAKNAIIYLGEEIKRVGIPESLPPLTFVFTGNGNVTQGSLEVFKLLPHEFVTVEQLQKLYKSGNFSRNKVYGCIIGPQDMVESISGTGFNKKDYYTNPQGYKPVFHETIAPYTSVLVNGMYWDAKFPRLLTKDQMAELHGKSPLMMVADISCDIEGSVEFLLNATTLDNPYYIYDPITRKAYDDLDGRGVMMLGVDNLPASLPRDASETFSEALTQFIPHLAKQDATVPFEKTELPIELKNACITSNGKLTERFKYIDRLRIKSTEKSERSKEGTGNVAALLIKGHLFDSGLINHLLNVFEGKCKSTRVLHWDLGPTTLPNQPSSVVLELTLFENSSVAQLLDQVHMLIDVFPASNATVQVLPFASSEPNLSEKIKEIVDATPIITTSPVEKTSEPLNRILVLGSGFVAAPVVEYLSRSKSNQVTIASNSMEQASAMAGRAHRVRPMLLDASDSLSLSKAIANSDIVVSLLPATAHISVAENCLKHKKHLVTASYISPDMRKLHESAARLGLTFLNEIGLDPGIDHMSAMSIIDQVKDMGGTIDSFESLCGGLPAPESADNPLGYKFSWSPRGVLVASQNPAQYKRNGEIVKIAGPDLLSTASTSLIIPTLNLEQYANRDSLQYGKIYGIESAHTIYRGTLRYSGFSNIMVAATKLGLLKTDANKIESEEWKNIVEKLVAVDSEGKTLPQKVYDFLDKNSSLGPSEKIKAIKAMNWLGLFSANKVTVSNSLLDSFCGLLQEKLSFKAGERDMAVLHHTFDVTRADNVKERITSSLVCYGDDKYSAMSRTVGYPAAIATQCILDGVITRKGVLDPTSRDIYIPILRELKKEGIECKENIIGFNGIL